MAWPGKKLKESASNGSDGIAQKEETTLPMDQTDLVDHCRSAVKHVSSFTRDFLAHR
jgi:hypothetical protein